MAPGAGVLLLGPLSPLHAPLCPAAQHPSLGPVADPSMSQSRGGLLAPHLSRRALVWRWQCQQPELIALLLWG